MELVRPKDPYKLMQEVLEDFQIQYIIKDNQKKTTLQNVIDDAEERVR